MFSFWLGRLREMSAACRTLADCQNLAEHMMARVGAVDEGKRRELQRMRRSKLMSLIASLVYPGDEDFLRRIDAMHSTAKDSMEDDDEANDEDDLMGDLVDELVLDDLNADDKQDFRMVSDAVQKRRIRRVQQTWQSIKKNVARKAKAKAKAKAKGKGKGKGRVRKFLRPRMLPKKRPRAPDEGRVPGPEADDQNVGMDGGVPRPEAADQNLEGSAGQTTWMLT